MFYDGIMVSKVVRYISVLVNCDLSLSLSPHRFQTKGLSQPGYDSFVMESVNY